MLDEATVAGGRTVIALSSLLAGLAVAIGLRGPRFALGRLALVRSPSVVSAPERPPLSAAGRSLAAGCGGLGMALLIGGPVGIVIGVAVAWSLARLVGRLEPRAARAARQQLAADLPLTLDLLTACLTAGQPLGPALVAVSEAVGGAVADRLRPVAAALVLGAEPAAAWSGVRADPALGALARAAARTGESGRGIADDVGRLAQTYRRRRKSAVEAKIRQVAVLAVGPLGLCFLPAFVAVGVVPVVLGLVHNSLG